MWVQVPRMVECVLQYLRHPRPILFLHCLPVLLHFARHWKDEFIAATSGFGGGTLILIFGFAILCMMFSNLYPSSIYVFGSPLKLKQVWAVLSNLKNCLCMFLSSLSPWESFSAALAVYLMKSLRFSIRKSLFCARSHLLTSRANSTSVMALSTPSFLQIA